MADPHGNIFPREHPAYVLIVHVAMRIHLARVATIGHHLIRLMIIDAIEADALFQAASSPSPFAGALRGMSR